MKSNLTRTIIALLIGVLTCGMMDAQTNYGIKIAGTELTSSNAYAINNTNFPGLALTSGTITYDHGTKTFTFNGVKVSMTENLNFMIISNDAIVGDYKINLIGNNSISSRAGSTIHTYRSLTIEGSGSLSLAAG